MYTSLAYSMLQEEHLTTLFVIDSRQLRIAGLRALEFVALDFRSLELRERGSVGSCFGALQFFNHVQIVFCGV